MEIRCNSYAVEMEKHDIIANPQFGKREKRTYKNIQTHLSQKILIKAEPDHYLALVISLFIMETRMLDLKFIIFKRRFTIGIKRY